jgi:hypothetical protein
MSKAWSRNISTAAAPSTAQLSRPTANPDDAHSLAGTDEKHDDDQLTQTIDSAHCKDSRRGSWHLMSETPLRIRKKGIGCLPALLILLLAGPLAIILIDLVFEPWIYVVGDRTRWLPIWSGVAAAQSPLGTYKVRVWFSPRPSGSRLLPAASVLGTAYVCTPTGKTYALRMTGAASGRIWRSMSGHTIELVADRGPFRNPFSVDYRPRLVFTGKWVGADLVMNDEGSIARAFLPDGNPNPDPKTSHPTGAALPITFHETTWGWLRSTCDN